jgi:hypothetical protein
MPLSFWVASTKPEAALAGGPEADMYCWAEH